MSLKSKTALVWDNGIFTEIAVTARQGLRPGAVLRALDQRHAEVERADDRRGPGRHRARRLALVAFRRDRHLDFPRRLRGRAAELACKQGKRVWGCRRGAELEIDRPTSKEACRKLGIDIGPYKVIEGLDALRKHLKANDDQWVKISGTRGDMETFGAKSYEKVEPRLDELEHNLGALKKVMKFTVEQGINDAIETGYDGYCIDGKFPKGAMTGVEVKDEAYLMKTVRLARPARAGPQRQREA
jgi:hypothetical protein